MADYGLNQVISELHYASTLTVCWSRTEPATVEEFASDLVGGELRYAMEKYTKTKNILIFKWTIFN